MRADPKHQKSPLGPVRVRVFGTIALVEGLPRSAIPSYLLSTATIPQGGVSGGFVYERRGSGMPDSCPPGC